jgi:hypothetical protein
MVSDPGSVPPIWLSEVNNCDYSALVLQAGLYKREGTASVNIQLLLRKIITNNSSFLDRSFPSKPIRICILIVLQQLVQLSHLCDLFPLESRYLHQQPVLIMARTKLDIPEDRTLQGVGDLTAKQIRAELVRDRITHTSKALKADLLPLLALSRLGIVDKDHFADPALLAKITGWCTVLVSDIKKELEDLSIKKGTNKWLDIENLIRAEYVPHCDLTWRDC